MVKRIKGRQSLHALFKKPVVAQDLLHVLKEEFNL